MAGVLRTRVGYAGGKMSNPTYHDLGQHAETIEIDYDPAVLTYEDLLDVFWDSHRPTGAGSWSSQYRSAIFYHDAEQKRLAEESMARQAKEWGAAIHTEIVSHDRFWRAEDYHQKYSLRRHTDVVKELGFATDRAFVDSTAAARLNGYLGGYGSRAAFEAEDLGLSADTRAYVLKRIR